MSGDFDVSRSYRAEPVSSGSQKDLRLAATKLTQFVLSQQLTQEESQAWSELDAFNPLAQTKNFEKLEKRRRTRISGSEDKESEGAGAKDERKIERVKNIDRIANYYQQKNRELPSSLLLMLRDSISIEDTPIAILDKVMEVFPDPSLADEALEFLLAALEDTPDKGTLSSNILQAKQLLEAKVGREVRAGRNIQPAAHEYEGSALETATQLRNLYRELITKPRHPYDLFHELSDTYDFEQTKALIAFLLHALGEDMNAKGPSIERAELVRLYSEARTLQAILGVYRFFASRMRLLARFYKQHGLEPNIFLSFELLSKSFMRLVKDRYPNSERVKQLAQLLHIEEEPIAQSITFTQFRDAVRSVSPRVYRDLQHQEDVLAAIIDALEEIDNKIEDEEKEAETEEEL